MKEIIVRNRSSSTDFFNPLFQQGFLIKIDGEFTVKGLLEKYYGIDKEYIDSTISTIFLNGKPVDEPDKTILQNGDTLALSGAMPGLVGAVLRSGSILRSFRDSITYKSEEKTSSGESRIITVKLFNRLTRKVGPVFLTAGILTEYGKLKTFISERIKISDYKYISIAIDDTELTLNEFADRVKNEEYDETVILKQAE